MSSTFEAAFISMLVSRLNDTDITVSWAQQPEGAPVKGKTDVVCYYAPGGEKQDTHSGMSGEESRRIQFSIFSVDPQDVKDVSSALHAIVDGARGTLSDGTKVFNIVPGIQDIDSYDNEERVFQTVFDVEAHIGLEAGDIPDLDEPNTNTSKAYIDAGDAATLAAAEAYADSVVESEVDTWDGITGKPATFPPSSHTHPESDVVNLVSDLAAEASARAAADTAEASTRASADTTEASTRASADSTEATARAAGDASTLATSEAYTDAATGFEVQSLSANTNLAYSTTKKLKVILATGGNSPGITLTLPTAVGHAGEAFLIKRVDSGSYNGIVTLAPSSGQTIDGRASVTLSNQWDTITIVSNGVTWTITGTKGGGLSSYNGGVNEIETTIVHESTYPVGCGVVLKATVPDVADYADAGPYGQDIDVHLTGAGNLHSLYGSRIYTYHDGSGHVIKHRGLDIFCQMTGSGTAHELFGAAIDVQNPGGGHVDIATTLFLDTETMTNTDHFAAIRIMRHLTQSPIGFGFGLAFTDGVNAICLTSSDPLNGIADGPTISSVVGTPEGVLAAPVGSIAVRSNGGAGTTLYMKESGTGNTGWKSLSQLLVSPSLSGTPTAPTPATGDDSTKIATTAFVEDTIDSLVAGDIPNIAESQVTNLVSDLALKAPLASPALTGSPTAPTQSAGDNSTKIATTAYADAAAASGGSAIKWSALVDAVAALTLNNAGNATTFNQTSAITWTWANTTVATSGTAQSSPLLKIAGQYWTGAASAADSWTAQDVIANGTNGTSDLTFTHAGSSGVAAVKLTTKLTTIAGSITLPSLEMDRGTASGLSYSASQGLNSIATSLGAVGCFAVLQSGNGVAIQASGKGILLSNGDLRTTTADTGIHRIGAASISIGTTTAGNASGTVKAAVFNTGTATWTSGTGSPESAVTAVVGSLFTRTDGGAATTLYVKESGSGNTGWVAK